MKWSVNIIRSLSLVCLCSHAVHAQVASQPTTTGLFGQEYVNSDFLTELNQKLGTGDRLNMNFLQPFISGRPIQSLNGQNSFTASKYCPTSSQFFQMLLQPSDTGDIPFMLIVIDNNFNHTSGYQFLLPADTRISGVCSNGIISCDAGTWNNCRYFKWVADNKYEVGISETVKEGMGGCFCINSNCGSNIVTKDLNYILQTLGDGAINAIHDKNPTLAIQKSQIDVLTITYYAQDQGNCSAASAAADTQLTGLYNDGQGGALDAAASNAAGSALADPNSLYSKLVNSQAMSANKSEFKKCTVKKTMSVNPQKVDPTYVYLPWLNIFTTCGWGRDSVNWCSIAVDIDRNSDGVYDAPKDMYSRGSGWTNSPDINTIGRNIANQTVVAEQSRYSIPVQNIQQDPTSEAFWGTDGGGSGGDGNRYYYGIKWKKISPPICPANYVFVPNQNNKCMFENDSVTTIDNCQTLAQDTSCVKKDELDDGVYVFKNYQTTGLQVLPSCRTMVGILNTYQECNPWWEKDMTYQCSDAHYDFSSAIKRSGNISKSTNSDSSGIHYQDMVTKNGQVTYTDNTIPYNPIQQGTPESCEYACKTKKPYTNTQVQGSNTHPSQGVTSEQYMVYIKVCNNQGCPIDASAGELLVQDCICQNNFVVGAAYLDIISTIGQDIICTNGMVQ